MAKHNIIATGFGKVAAYPHVTDPDTFGEYADNKYKVSIAFDATELKRIKKLATDFAAASDKLKTKKPKLPFKDVNDVECFVAKTKFKPVVLDMKKQPIDDSSPVGEDSVIRVSGYFEAYDKGITFRLLKVQVKELKLGFVKAEAGAEFDGDEDDTDDFGDDADGSDALDI